MKSAPDCNGFFFISHETYRLISSFSLSLCVCVNFFLLFSKKEAKLVKTSRRPNFSDLFRSFPLFFVLCGTYNIDSSFYRSIRELCWNQKLLWLFRFLTVSLTECKLTGTNIKQTKTAAAVTTTAPPPHTQNYISNESARSQFISNSKVRNQWSCACCMKKLITHFTGNLIKCSILSYEYKLFSFQILKNPTAEQKTIEKQKWSDVKITDCVMSVCQFVRWTLILLRSCIHLIVKRIKQRFATCVLHWNSRYYRR